jgi:hypothetical protein
MALPVVFGAEMALDHRMKGALVQTLRQEFLGKICPLHDIAVTRLHII